MFFSCDSELGIDNKKKIDSKQNFQISNKSFIAQEASLLACPRHHLFASAFPNMELYCDRVAAELTDIANCPPRVWEYENCCKIVKYLTLSELDFYWTFYWGSGESPYKYCKDAFWVPFHYCSGPLNPYYQVHIDLYTWHQDWIILDANQLAMNNMPTCTGTVQIDKLEFVAFPVQPQIFCDNSTGGPIPEPNCTNLEIVLKVTYCCNCGPNP
ncbi:MAG: hypothetical protein IPQ02_15450 [Saprospiraceae bacterium]|nr:hypothetical protein [Candidatus Defluviibacterium haderslevense]